MAHPVRPLVTRVGAGGDGVHPGLGAFDAHAHVHELVADGLAFDERGAKGLALARPVHCFVVAGLGKAQGHGAHGQALAVEVAHDHAKARALFAQAVAHRHAHAVEAQVRGVGAVPAHLLQRAARDAGPVHGHDQHADAAGAFVAGVCSHSDREPVGAHAGGDEDLLTVDHVLVALAARGGAQRSHVGPAPGFGDAQGRDAFRHAARAAPPRPAARACRGPAPAAGRC